MRMSKKASLVISDYKNEYQGEATFQGYTVTVYGRNEDEIKRNAFNELVEQDEIKKTDKIEWNTIWC